MFDLYLKGGWLMHPILLISVLALSISLERSWYFYCLRDRKLVKRFHEIEAALNQQNITQAQEILTQTTGPVSQVLALGLADDNVAQAAEKMAIAGEKATKEAQKGLSLLALIPSIATMIGLLGTVLGLALAFQKVSLLKDDVSPALLASGIWVALITTVAGLLVAIPTLVSHHFLHHQITELQFEIEHYGSRLLLLKKISEGNDTEDSLNQAPVKTSPQALPFEASTPLS